MKRRFLDREALQAPTAFKELGAVLLPQVLAPDEVVTIRQRLLEAESSRVIQLPDILDFSFFESVFLNHRILDGAKHIFGEELVLFPSFQLQRNSFTNSRAKRSGSGWHVDASAEAELGVDYLFQRSEAWANIGVYLQDATNAGYGGGISIIPGSHKLYQLLSFNRPLARSALSVILKVLRRIDFDRFGWCVPIEPGDAVLFDCRLIHSSIPCLPQLLSEEDFNKNSAYQAFVTSVPRKNEKLVFYSFCSSVDLEREIMSHNFLRRVPNKAGQKLVRLEQGFDYLQALEVCFPKDYPQRVLDAVSEAGVRIARAGAEA